MFKILVKQMHFEILMMTSRVAYLFLNRKLDINITYFNIYFLEISS